MLTLNGKIEEEYGYLDQLTPSGLAFEFLRRNPKYCGDFHAQEEVREKLYETYGPIDVAQKEWRSDSRVWVCEPPLAAEETLEHWRRRAMLGDTEHRQVWFEEWYREKWALVDRLPDPSVPADPPPAFSTTGSFPMFADYEKIGRFFYGDDPLANLGPCQQRIGYAVAVFDLSLPLKDQFKIAETVIKQRAKQQKNDGAITSLKTYTPGQVHQLFCRYLRALDMEAAGMKPAKIGKILFPYKINTKETSYNVTKTASGTLEQARQYVEWKYRAIPLFNFTSG